MFIYVYFVSIIASSMLFPSYCVCVSVVSWSLHVDVPLLFTIQAAFIIFFFTPVFCLSAGSLVGLSAVLHKTTEKIPIGKGTDPLIFFSLTFSNIVRQFFFYFSGYNAWIMI